MLKFNPVAIIEARKKQNLTQTELALKLHCRRQRVAQIENGFHKPNINTIERVWAALNIIDSTPFFVQQPASEQANSEAA